LFRDAFSGVNSLRRVEPWKARKPFDFAPLFAAALALLRNWPSGAGESAAWRDRNSAREGTRDQKPAQDARRLDMRRAETLPGARGANVSGRKELSSRMFFIAAALAIVLIACVLGRATFQSDSDPWKPLGATENSFVGQ
jgi:hypothetical protein